MKTDEFQRLLLRSAISAMACDGEIDETEVAEIRNMADNEIYFMGFRVDEPFETDLDYLKSHGKQAINEYLSQLSQVDLNPKQEILLIEVLIRTIESDGKVEDGEIKFLHLVKSKLKISEEDLIIRFPNQMKYIIDFHNYGLHEEFTDEISLSD